MPYVMKNRLLFIFIFLAQAYFSCAQQPFVEGSIRYKVAFESADHKILTGSYVFHIKEGKIRKELTLSNGFQDVVIINTNNNTVYSLRAMKNGKKFAIQLSMKEMQDRQEMYRGFLLQPANKDKEIAGLKCEKGTLKYKNNTNAEIYYSGKWYINQDIAYERFPGARFIPMLYDYTDSVKGFTMHMEATEVSATPVENAIFRIPADYRIISNDEYKQLSQQ